jgi:hypothetical protein
MPDNFRVYEYPHDVAHPRDIMFQLTDTAKKTIPKEESALKSEAERTLHVLRALYSPTEETEFRPYFAELLGLCQYGLVGKTAQPTQAMATLRNLQQQIFDNEKGRAISTYMIAVIRSQALWLGGIILVIAASLLATYLLVGLDVLRNEAPCLAILPGLFVGITFSSFIRCRAITFYDLHAIEADRFSPGLKLAFALATLFLAAAFLKAELIEIKIGKAQLSAFDKDYVSAFVFGAVVGVAQEAIIAKIETIKDKVLPNKARRKK